MNSFNFIGVICKGREGSEGIELRTSEKGTKIAVFTLAVYDTFQKSNDFHRITAFGKTAEIVAERCQPGDQIGVQGRVKDYRYTSKKDGNERFEKSFILEKVTLPKKESGDPRRANPDRGREPDQTYSSGGDDDNIPF